MPTTVGIGIHNGVVRRPFRWWIHQTRFERVDIELRRRIDANAGLQGYLGECRGRAFGADAVLCRWSRQNVQSKREFSEREKKDTYRVAIVSKVCFDRWWGSRRRGRRSERERRRAESESESGEGQLLEVRSAASLT